MPDAAVDSNPPTESLFSSLRADTPVVPVSALLPELMPWNDTASAAGDSSSQQQSQQQQQQQQPHDTAGTTSSDPAGSSRTAASETTLAHASTGSATSVTAGPSIASSSGGSAAAASSCLTQQMAGYATETSEKLGSAVPETNAQDDATTSVTVGSPDQTSGSAIISRDISPGTENKQSSGTTVEDSSKPLSPTRRARQRARERLMRRAMRKQADSKTLSGDPAILPEPGLVSAFIRSRQRAYERSKLQESRLLVPHRRALLAKGPSDAFKLTAGGDRDLSLRYRGWELNREVHRLKSARRVQNMGRHTRIIRPQDAPDWEVDIEESLYDECERMRRRQKLRDARSGRLPLDEEDEDFDYFGFDDFEIGWPKGSKTSVDPDENVNASTTDADEDDDSDDFSDIAAETSSMSGTGLKTTPTPEPEPEFQLQRGLRRLLNLANLREGFAADLIPPIVSSINVTDPVSGRPSPPPPADLASKDENDTMSIEGRVNVVLRAWRYHTRAKRAEGVGQDNAQLGDLKSDDELSDSEDREVKGLPADGLLPVTTELFTLSAYVNRSLFSKLLRFQEHRSQVTFEQDSEGKTRYRFVPSQLSELRAAADEAAEAAQLALEQLRENLTTESEARTAVATATRAEAEHASKLLITPNTLIAAHSEVFRHLDPSARLFYVLLSCPPPLRATLRGVPTPAAMRAYFFVGHDASAPYLDHSATESDRVATELIVLATRVESAMRLNMLVRRFLRRRPATSMNDVTIEHLTDNTDGDLIDEELATELRQFGERQQTRYARRKYSHVASTSKAGSDDEASAADDDDDDYDDDDPHDWLNLARQEIWNEDNLYSLLRSLPDSLWRPFLQEADNQLRAEADMLADVEINMMINAKRREYQQQQQQRDHHDLDQFDVNVHLPEGTITEIRQRFREKVYENHIAQLAAERTNFVPPRSVVEITQPLPLTLAQKAARVTRLLDPVTVALLDAATGLPVFEPNWLDGMFLKRGDFIPLVTEVLHTHPGLEFLANLPDFQQRYAQTVVARIYYALNPSGDERLRVRDIRRAKLLDRLAVLASEEDINKVRAFFSYEHFYVIYCKFWELDLDHDMRLDYEDLLRYEDGSLTERIVARVFSQAPRKFLGDSGVNPTMSYVDFVVFLISEVDKTSRVSITYWFKCIDLDNDGIITTAELEYFFEEQRAKIARLTHENMLTSDIVCQITDMIAPASRTPVFTLRDFLRSKLSGQVFDILFNLTKFTIAESRDPVRLRELHSSVLQSDWERWSVQTYHLLAGAEQEEEEVSNSAAAAAVANAAVGAGMLGDMDGSGGLGGAYALTGADFDVEGVDSDFHLMHGQGTMSTHHQGQLHHQQQSQQMSQQQLSQQHQQQQQMMLGQRGVSNGRVFGESDIGLGDGDGDDIDIDDVEGLGISIGGRPQQQRLGLGVGMSLGVGMGVLMPQQQLSQAQQQSQQQQQQQLAGIDNDAMGVGYPYGTTRFGGPAIDSGLDDDLTFEGHGLGMALGASAAVSQFPSSSVANSAASDENIMRDHLRR